MLALLIIAVLTSRSYACESDCPGGNSEVLFSNAKVCNLLEDTAAWQISCNGVTILAGDCVSNLSCETQCFCIGDKQYTAYSVPTGVMKYTGTVYIGNSFYCKDDPFGKSTYQTDENGNPVNLVCYD